jgi:Fe2+ transport system protein FeoA
MTVTLDKLPINTDAIIVSNSNERQVDLGLCAGTRLRVISRSLFNGPIAIQFGTSCFAFRLHELSNVYVKVTP